MENLGFSTQFKTISKFERALQTKLGDFWMLRGEHQALKLFHQMSLRVPAYKDFLKKNKVNPQNVHTIKDFLRLPTIDKNNYLRAYPLDMLCWDGKLAEGQYVISTTSGSTGEPFYFPRTEDGDAQYQYIADLFFRNQWNKAIRPLSWLVKKFWPIVWKDDKGQLVRWTDEDLVNLKLSERL